MNTAIYLRRRKKVYLEKDNNFIPMDSILNLLKNLECYGYTLSPELLTVVQSLSLSNFNDFYYSLLDAIKEIKGKELYEPMYPNFPDQVIEMSQFELYSNAFMHYIGDWIGKRIIPLYTKIAREELKDIKDLKKIELGSIEDFNKIFTRLLNSKISISPTDRNDLNWFIANYKNDIYELIPNKIPNKENLAIFIAALINNDMEISEIVSNFVSTATDVLRILTAISNGDVSLRDNSKFINLSRPKRKYFLSILEKCSNINEDFLRYPDRWKRVGEILHPFDYKNKFPRCYQAFDIIRNDREFYTFNSKVETSIITQDIIKATNLLKSRPGELARRIDKLVRISSNPSIILEALESVATSISTTVLLQLHAHFKNRNISQEIRTFIPKGNISSIMAIRYNLPDIDVNVCNEIVAICEKVLINKFESYAPLGKVYLDDSIKNFTVPFAIRSASKALKTIPRGSRIDLSLGDTIRFFIYWKDGTSRTDLDLSALALDKDSNVITTIAYYNLKELGGYHSGDITSAPNGASEFIDIDIPQFLDKGIRYIVMVVNSFTTQPYCDLPICFAGFMMRQFPKSGEIYEPSTLENRFDLTANTKIAIPLIIDLEERKVIWTDLSMDNLNNTSNNVNSHLPKLTMLNKAMTTLKKPILYDLLMLHTKARGVITSDINEANTIFSLDKGITPFDIEILVSDFL
ncbi:MAG: TerD family protein [Candidatus Kapabacteria bacterium]|nr:TerD family protein [Candidatus Kapabacteria bacterium]